MKKLSLLLVLLVTLVGCTKEPIEPIGLTEYHIIHVYPDSETVYVQHNDGAFEKLNTKSDDYDIEFTQYDGQFRLAVDSYKHSISKVKLSAIDTQNLVDIDLEWKVEGESFTAKGNLVDTRYYVLALYQKIN